MRVCMLVYNPLTHDARVFREASALAAEGHSVDVVGFHVRGLEEVEARDGFTIRRIRRRSLRVWLRRQRRRLGWAWLRLLAALGRPRSPQTLPAAGPGGVLQRWQKLLDYWWQGYRLARELPPADVYHAHDLNTLPLGVAAARRAGAALVYDSHELFPERQVLRLAEKPVWRLIERLLIKRADRMITVSDRYAEEFVRRYGVERPLVLLNCPELRGRVPANGSGRSLRRKADLDGDAPIVIFQGLIALERGLEDLVAAAKQLPEVAVVMLGQGSFIPQLQELVDAEGVGDRVKLPGPVPSEELLSYTAGATIGVAPIEGGSLSQAYTVQNKIFEYMGAGLPIVATRLPGTERIIEEHEVGLFCEPGDVGGLADAIRRLLTDQELYRRLRENAIAASKIFNWEQESKKLLALYATL